MQRLVLLAVWLAALHLTPTAIPHMQLPALVPALASGIDGSTTVPVALVLSTTCLICGLWLNRWIHSQNKLEIAVRDAQFTQGTETISVCVPARNEQRNIAACTEAILKQTYPAFEVIVVNDGSSDNTGEILSTLKQQSTRLQVINGAPLPDGWAGKPHALHQAAGLASGGWLCFVDADTLLSPNALSTCFATAMQTGADLLSIITSQVTGSFWERTMLPLVLTGLSVGFSPHRVNGPARREAIANGQFIMIRRHVFDAIGGYARIRDRVAEDKAIAEQVKWNGYRLVLADGRQIARTRMYTTLGEMWEGWTKNIYVGLRDQPRLLLLGVFGVVLLLVAAFFIPLWPVLGIWWFAHGGGWEALLVIAEAIIVWGAILSARAAAASAMGIPRWYALTTPLGCAVFAAMMLTSAWLVLSGQGVTWRGRRYRQL